ncbi:hypothetical protein [Nocardia sp. NBC_01329]|uniref:hypothetical protein n=1 Tax=Nocardia sp. NBC_01329 TaxID=2903594 RepID=UPI002E135EBC|nr:hypothetical protein OG405_28825 [Nocardia sp. NBC_01329]
MDAENASLGDGRRGRQEEYGRAQHNSESRGFAGFGSNEFDSANGSNGSTNRSEPIPDHGYTWTPAPPSTPPQNQHSTGGSAALDPFAAWNTSGVIGDASAVGVMTSGSQEPDSRFSSSPSEPSRFPAPPDDRNGPDTAALATRHSAGPEIRPGQADEHSAALASSARIPVPGTPYSPEPLPTTGTAEGAAFAYPVDPEAAPGPADSYGSSPDAGSLPSWLSSIGEEPAPHPLESGGRRRKVDLTESAESAETFNPFEDQHTTEPAESAAVSVSDPYELPAIPSDQRESETVDDDLAVRPELPSRGLPSRSPRTHTASAPGTDEEPAAASITARRLPRSAARHAPAPSADAPVSANAHEARTDTGSEPETAHTATGAESLDNELPAPRRLPRGALRYNPDDDRSGSRGEQPAALRIAAPAPDTAPADDAGAHTVAPPRLAPPGDSTPILDRLLDPEPAHRIDTVDESGAGPVAEILNRILESDPGPSRHSDSDEPEEAEAAVESSVLSPLTLVPDDTSESFSDTRTDDADARPPLETRRSRRAREAAEATGPTLPDLSEPELPAPDPDPDPDPLPELRPAPVDDTASRHSRSEEGADIDIHLIMRLLTASDDLEVLAGQAETGEVSAAEVARAAREARAAVLSAVTAWYGGPAQMVKFANALLQAARES